MVSCTVSRGGSERGLPGLGEGLGGVGRGLPSPGSAGGGKRARRSRARQDAADPPRRPSPSAQPPKIQSSLWFPDVRAGPTLPNPLLNVTAGSGMCSGRPWASPARPCACPAGNRERPACKGPVCEGMGRTGPCHLGRCRHSSPRPPAAATPGSSGPRLMGGVAGEPSTGLQSPHLGAAAPSVHPTSSKASSMARNSPRPRPRIWRPGRPGGLHVPQGPCWKLSCTSPQGWIWGGLSRLSASTGPPTDHPASP